MTTEAAERFYEAEHVWRCEGLGAAFFNPQNKPLTDLPVIYGYNNGGSPGFMSAELMAEDGTYLGGHICSSEAYMPADLGILEGTRPDRHEKDFQPHYPDGYRMEFVSGDPRKHAGLMAAYKLNQEMRVEAGEAADGQSAANIDKEKQS